MTSNTTSAIFSRVATASFAAAVSLPAQVATLPNPNAGVRNNIEKKTLWRAEVPSPETAAEGISADNALLLLKKLVTQHQSAVAEDQKLFSGLLEEWREATALSSNPMQAILAKPYQRIIGMGKRALPFIFSELPKCQDNWFWALESITGENPVSKEHYSNFRLATEDWVRWGQRRGFRC